MSGRTSHFTRMCDLCLTYSTAVYEAICWSKTKQDELFNTAREYLWATTDRWNRNGDDSKKHKIKPRDATDHIFMVRFVLFWVIFLLATSVIVKRKCELKISVRKRAETKQASKLFAWGLAFEAAISSRSNCFETFAVISNLGNTVEVM